jgi:hypothetical protein
MLTEDLTTRAQGTVIRNSVEQVYREKGYEAARAHLDRSLSSSAQIHVTDKIRTQTLGWLRSEEAGLRGERDGIAKEWAAAKGQISTLSPDVLTDIQNRAYSVGAFKSRRRHSGTRLGAEHRQGPAATAASRSDARARVRQSRRRLTQRESGGDPTSVNKLGYVGTYQFGAPRLADLGVYTPGRARTSPAGRRRRRTRPANGPARSTSRASRTSRRWRISRPTRTRRRPHSTCISSAPIRRSTSSGSARSSGRPSAACRSRATASAPWCISAARRARATLSSGGAYNPADANGTTLLDYARLGDSGASPGSLGSSRAGLIATGMLKKDMTQDLGKKISDFQVRDRQDRIPADGGDRRARRAGPSARQRGAEAAGRRDGGAGRVRREVQQFPQAQRRRSSAAGTRS